MNTIAVVATTNKSPIHNVDPNSSKYRYLTAKQNTRSLANTKSTYKHS